MSHAIMQNKQTLQGLLGKESVMQSLADVAQKHLPPEKICKLALVAASRNPKIFECTQESVLQSVMQAAQLGLAFDGTSGQGYLVPYGKQCTFIIGYKGMVTLARQSGDVGLLHVDVVCENDQFDHGVRDAMPYVEHRPPLNARGEVIGAYAICVFKDGGKQVAVMGRDDLEAIRNRSRASANGPWKTDPKEMCKKTVLRRLMKLLPQVPELDRIFAQEDRFVEPNRAVNPFKTQPTADVEADEVGENAQG